MIQYDRKSSWPRRLLKLLAHRVAFPATERVNLTLFKLAGVILRPVATPIRFMGSLRVLVFAPHPDDETLGCGGTIALHAGAGDNVRVAVVTDGGRSRAFGLTRDQIVTLRRAEAESALAELQPRSGGESGMIDLEQWAFPEGEWSAPDVTARIRDLLAQFKPDVVYTVSRIDFHPEHKAVARCLAQAMASGDKISLDVRVRVFELQVPLTPVLVNRLAFVGTVESSKDLALAKYTTQQGSFAWLPRHRKYLLALHRTRTAVEAFWEMDARRFCRLHSADVALGRFRSIRLRPFTDILAWLIGMQARLELRRVVDEAGRVHG